MAFKLFDRSPATPVVELTISNRTIVRILLMVVVTTLGLAALRQAQHAIILVSIALFLALAFNAPVNWLAVRLPGRLKGNRSFATSVSFLALALVMALFLASVIPPIVRETGNFLDRTPELLSSVHNDNSAVGKLIDRYGLESEIDKFSSQLGDRLKNASGAAVSTVSTVGTSLFTTLTVFVLTFMMLIEGPHWVGWIRRLIPPARREDASVLSSRMYRVVRGYVNGQVTLAAIAALVLLPGLLFLGISYPFALMFVVFICGLIPMIGHTIGAAIVFLVALTTSIPAAFIILGYYILYQQLENIAVQPKIQANSTELSPLLVFVAVVIGVSFSGLLGGLVAIPLMGCLRVFMLYWLEKRDIRSPRVTTAAKPKAS